MWLRKGIDFYRQSKKTAVNQSAAPIATAREVVKCRRRVRFANDGVVITDDLTGSGLTNLPIGGLAPIGSSNGREQELRKSWKAAVDAIGATQSLSRGVRIIKHTALLHRCNSCRPLYHASYHA